MPNIVSLVVWPADGMSMAPDSRRESLSGDECCWYTVRGPFTAYNKAVIGAALLVRALQAGVLCYVSQVVQCVTRGQS